MFKLGLLINPIAGIGGSVALKGSDGVVSQAKVLGAEAKSNYRASQALNVLQPYSELFTIYTVSGDMGESAAHALEFNTHVVYSPPHNDTDASDTQAAVKSLLSYDIDLLLFAGGDGTARDIAQVVDESCPVLGIPAGCKIHSGVYAVTPIAAGRVVELMLTNQLVSLIDADVMDIDESLFREGVVKAKRFGEMRVPSQVEYIQAVKSGGKESDELVLQDIAAFVIDEMDDNLCIIGSGSTTAFIMQELGITNSLLGVDIIKNETLLCNDITEPDLWELLNKHDETQVKLIITLIGGQGHLFGRGNQQLSPRVIKLVGKENIIVVATKTKLTALNQRPLIADTGDETLDQALSGVIPVITGYNDQVLYPITSPQ